jgi:hypothetical protein
LVGVLERRDSSTVRCALRGLSPIVEARTGQALPTRRQPLPLPVQISERLAQLALGLHFEPAALDPRVKRIGQRHAVLESPREALLEALAQTLGLGLDVEERAVDRQSFGGACVAAAQGFDQLAAAVALIPCSR